MIPDFLEAKVKGCGESEKQTYRARERTSARRSQGRGDQSPLRLSGTSGIRRVVEAAGTRSSVLRDVWRPYPGQPNSAGVNKQNIKTIVTAADVSYPRSGTTRFRKRTGLVAAVDTLSVA